MRLLTKEELVARVPETYKGQYFKNGAWRHTTLGDSELTYKALVAADPLTAEKVFEIIGNNSWAMLTCGCCKQDVGAVVIFAVADSEYSLYLCFRCLTKASSLSEGSFA